MIKYLEKAEYVLRKEEMHLLADSVATAILELASLRSIVGAREYGVMREASMPDMSGREAFTQVVGATFTSEDQALQAARRIPSLRGVPPFICERMPPGGWKRTDDSQ